MEVHDPFDQDDLAAHIRGASEHVCEAVRWEICPAGAAQVQVTRFGTLDRPRPEAADPAVFVAPGAAQPARPARVSEDAGCSDLVLAVAGMIEQPACVSRP